uniref:Kelch domain containing 3 n=1 Tax=Cyprinus carpio carpio TaxID=630221 RepID=A0A9J7X0Z6_CYPCA
MLRWTVHLEGGPRRVNHAAVAVGHKVYSFGGYCSGEDYETLRQIDVHVFNTVSLRWTKLPPVRTGGREHAREVPYMRYGHTAVLVDETVLIWGGRNDTEGACNVLYAFDVCQHRWFTPKISGTVPGARDGHSACVLGKAMYIFGGYEQLLPTMESCTYSVDIMLVWIDTSTTSGSSIQRRSPGKRWSPRAKAHVPEGDSAAVWWEITSSSSEEPVRVRSRGWATSLTSWTTRTCTSWTSVLI